MRKAVYWQICATDCEFYVSQWIVTSLTHSCEADTENKYVDLTGISMSATKQQHVTHTIRATEIATSIDRWVKTRFLSKSFIHK
jgi:ribulose bisphosphate carboxylase small subunit